MSEIFRWLSWSALLVVNCAFFVDSLRSDESDWTVAISLAAALVSANMLTKESKP